MSSKKKGSAKKATTSEDFAEVCEAQDDDGTMHPHDVNLLIRLLGSSTKPFQKIALEFLEGFKNRFVYSVGLALMTFYENNRRDDQIEQRLIACYLIYRVRDLECPLKKKGETEVIGHPFISFFLSVLDMRHNEGDDFMPSVYERSLVERIVSRSLGDIPNTTPQKFVESFEEFTGDLSEVRGFYGQQRRRFPLDQTISEFPSVAPKSPLSKAEFNEDMEKTFVSMLCGREPFIYRTPVPSWFSIPLPPLKPPADEKVEIYPTLSVPEFLVNNQEWSNTTVVDSNQNKFSTHIASSAPIHVASPTKQFAEMTSSIASTSREANNSAECASASSSFGKGPSSALHSDSSNDASISALAEKALMGPLGPQERKILGEVLMKEAELMTEGPYTKLFTQLNFLPKLIEDSPSVASAAIVNRLNFAPELIHRYVSVLLGIDASVQCMEVAMKCYTTCRHLDREPLIAFVSYCIESCQGQDAQGHRLARAVCVFLSNLIKNKALRVKDLSTELHDFCMRYTSVRETSSLYQTIVAAKIEENKQQTLSS